MTVIDDHPALVAVALFGLLVAGKGYLVAGLGYPASPAEVETPEDRRQYCSYSTACDVVYPDHYGTVAGLWPAAIAAGAGLLAGVRYICAGGSDV